MRAGRQGHFPATLPANDNHPPPHATSSHHWLPTPTVTQPQISPMVTQRGGIKPLLDLEFY